MTDNSIEQRALERWQHRRALLWVAGGGLLFVVTFAATFAALAKVAGWW